MKTFIFMLGEREILQVFRVSAARIGNNQFDVKENVKTANVFYFKVVT